MQNFSMEHLEITSVFPPLPLQKKTGDVISERSLKKLSNWKLTLKNNFLY